MGNDKPCRGRQVRLRSQSSPAGTRWVLDTAYGTWRDIPLANVELIVALDFSRSVSLYRLVSRTIRRLFDRKTICNGNRETLRTMFSRDSIILWHFKSFKSKHSRIADWAKESDGPKTLRFTRPKDTETWLASLGPP